MSIQKQQRLPTPCPPQPHTGMQGSCRSCWRWWLRATSACLSWRGTWPRCEAREGIGCHGVGVYRRGHANSSRRVFQGPGAALLVVESMRHTTRGCLCNFSPCPNSRSFTQVRCQLELMKRAVMVAHGKDVAQQVRGAAGLLLKDARLSQTQDHVRSHLLKRSLYGPC